MLEEATQGQLDDSDDYDESDDYDDYDDAESANAEDDDTEYDEEGRGPEMSLHDLVADQDEGAAHIGLRAKPADPSILKLLLLGSDDAKSGLASALMPEQYSLSPNLIARRASVTHEDHSLSSPISVSPGHVHSEHSSEEHSVSVVEMKGYGSVKLAVWDEHGYEQRHFDSEGHPASDVLMGAAGVIFAFDVADRASLTYVEKTLDWLLADPTFDPARTRCFLVGNRFAEAMEHSIA
jgi:hypothetical protein